MGIFSNSTPFDQIVDKATHETNTKEDWALILDICDKIGASPQHAKDCLKSIIKRLNHPDPHVELQAITLLDACVSNCGLNFHLEIASREFEQEFRKILHKTQEKTIRDKLLSCLEKWALNEFKTDPQLNLIPSMYNKLKHAGAEFPSSADSDSPSKGKKSGGGSSGGHKSKSHSSSSGGGSSAASNASAVAQKEADDIAKAIELSLKESQQQSPKSLYPQVALSGGSGGVNSSSNHNSHSGGGGTNVGNMNHVVEPRKVRALYDFEAAEDNELTFYAGEIVHVLDDSDTNWWEGSNQRGTGLFPANFVTADLSAELPNLESTAKKSVQFNDEVVVKTVEAEPEQVEIDEAKIDNALHLLHEADPTGETVDPPELAVLEDQVQQMGSLIDQELEKVDRRHAQLTKLGSELVEALNLYHTLMRDPSLGPQQQPPNMQGYNPRMGPPPTSMPPYSMPPTMQQQPPPGAYPYYQNPPTSAVSAYGPMPMHQQQPHELPGQQQQGGGLGGQPMPQHQGPPQPQQQQHMSYSSPIGSQAGIVTQALSNHVMYGHGMQVPHSQQQQQDGQQQHHQGLGMVGPQPPQQQILQSPPTASSGYQL